MVPIRVKGYGLGFMVYGLWFRVYGLWFRDYGLWSWCWSFEIIVDCVEKEGGGGGLLQFRD